MVCRARGSPKRRKLLFAGGIPKLAERLNCRGTEAGIVIVGVRVDWDPKLGNFFKSLDPFG